MYIHTHIYMYIHTHTHTHIYIYIYIYNAKCESMKDCKCFFYQYLKFHVFTRQLSANWRFSTDDCLVKI